MINYIKIITDNILPPVKLSIHYLTKINNHPVKMGIQITTTISSVKIGYMISKKEEKLKKLLLAVKRVEEADHIDLCKKEIAKLSLREEVM